MIERYFLEQGMKKLELEAYFKEHLDKAGFTGLEVVKTPMVTRIVLSVARPGLAIGKGGQNIRALTEEISKKFKIDNPQIEIKELGRFEHDAKATADKVKALLERGFSWRSVAFKLISDISKSGAQGVELVLSGKLAGKGGRKKRVRVAYGYMKKVGEQAKLVDYAKITAYPKPGAIGLKVKIIRPGVVFPDKINLKEIIAKKKEAMAAVTETPKEEIVVKKNVEEKKIDEKKVKKKTVVKRKKEKTEEKSAEKDGEKIVEKEIEEPEAIAIEDVEENVSEELNVESDEQVAM